ncbi:MULTISPECIES: hypothetical protein [Rhizobium]|uniref:hypothetical protein n=1 Tax=Rhizobium TaxID=379 RepID=UPI001FE1AB59|nr:MULTISPECIES: hypothetical protein [Rhizobium]WET75875.1 hypothetical protein PYR68_10500 [Rhizobium croatiense]
MAYRDIVVYLDVGEDCAARVRTAIDVAVKHQARLIGVNVSTKEALEGESRDLARAIEAEFATAGRKAPSIFNITRHGQRLMTQRSFFPIARIFW